MKIRNIDERTDAVDFLFRGVDFPRPENRIHWSFSHDRRDSILASAAVKRTDARMGRNSQKEKRGLLHSVLRSFGRNANLVH